MPTPLLRGLWAPPALLLLIALAIRVWDFGNPVIHVDEQYYLLVGDSLLHGAVPFVDIWDRKPIGLFLLFAGMRLLPGDGILAYQIVAALCVWATALIVRRGALSIGADARGALGAAIAYIAGLSLLGGGGGQSPVFYNLPVALAALLTLRLPVAVAVGDRRLIVRNGVVACLLGGVAIQMKYTPAFEGAFFGLAHVWCLRRAGARPPVLAGAIAIWIAAGLAPTLAAIGWYAAHGAFGAFWFANVTSILLRPGYPPAQVAMRLLGIAILLSPLIAAVPLAWRARARSGPHAEANRLALGWLIAALVGFLAIGTFFDHYALTLLGPLAIVAAPAFSRHRPLLVIALVVPLAIIGAKRVAARDDAPGARTLARIVAANSNGACPYVFIGDTITYHLAHACVPTAYAFPNLLAYATERGATGINEAAEVRRILAKRPPVIVTSDRRLSIWNPASLRAVKAALERDYRPVFATPRAQWRSVVYLRRDRRFRTSPRGQQ